MSVKKNVLANYVGSAWSAIMGIIFVPVYINYLGMEAYGLIGLFAILQAWLTLLDLGMSPTLSREMARHTAGAHTAQSIRDLLRSIEIICVIISIFIMGLVWLSSAWLSTDWLQLENLSPDQVSQAILIMGIVASLRFVEGIYRGTLIGLQKQVWLSAVGAGLSTLRGAGAVFVLMWIEADIKTFFIWQGVMSVLTLCVFISAVYYHLPHSPAKFSCQQLKNIWKFAGGVMATTFLSLLLMQVDKILLSNLLSLKLFGYYVLAGAVAATLYQLINPITQAYYPRFTELVTKNNTTELIRLYHQASQLLSVLLVPASFMLIFNGEELLYLWTGDEVLASTVNPILVLLALGTMIHGFMNIPYILTLANAWSSWGVYLNLIAVSILVPAIFLIVPSYGAIGAAWIWVTLNFGYIFFAVHMMHRRLLQNEKWRWYLNDIASPILAALLVVSFFEWIKPDFLSKISEGFWLLMVGLSMVLATLLAASSMRTLLFTFFAKKQ